MMIPRFLSCAATAALLGALSLPAIAQDAMKRDDIRDYRDRYSDDLNYDVWYYTDRDDENLRRELDRRDVDRDDQRQVFSSPTHRSATDMRGSDWNSDYNRWDDRYSDAYRYDRDVYDYNTEDRLQNNRKQRDVKRSQERMDNFTNPAMRGATDLDKRYGRDDYDRYDYDRYGYNAYPYYDYPNDNWNNNYDRWERRQARTRDLDQDNERGESWSHNPALRSATDLDGRRSDRSDYYRDYEDDYNDYDYDYDDDLGYSRYHDYNRDPDQDAERHVFTNPALRGATDLGQREYRSNRMDRNEIDFDDNR